MRTILMTIMTFGMMSCHTTARWFESDIKEAAQTKDFKITNDDLEELRPLIVSLELQYGVFPPKKRMYTTVYNIHCHQDGAIQACQIRLVLDVAPYLSEGMDLSSGLSEKLFLSFFKERKELEKSRQVFADYNCESINSSAPPFSEKSKFCRVMNPRKVNEFFTKGATAQEISKIQNQSNSLPSNIVRSKLSCDVADTFVCQISDKANPKKTILKDRISNELSKNFKRSYLQKWAILSGKNQVNIPRIKMLEGEVECSTLSKMTRSNFACLVEFE